MGLSKQELSKIDFKDEFSFEELKKESEGNDSFFDLDACCYICGDKLENLKIGFNANEQAYKYECSNCNSIYVIYETAKSTKKIILQGEERNWPEYLAETLVFPFFAGVEEDDARAFFNLEYEGPRMYDTVKVLSVHYAVNYGVVAKVKKDRKTYFMALCFLEGLDDHHFKELDDYKRWRESYWVSDLFAGLIRAEEDE